MRWIRGIIAALALAGAAPSHAAWHEASSNHFVIYADMPPDQLQNFASRLERYDAALRYVFLRDRPADEGARSNRLRIYVLSDASAVRRLCRKRCPDILGFYTPRAGGSVAFTPRRSGDGSRYDLDAETVLFHEYAHHFMYANFTAAYPAWYTEGFAEFNSTARFERDGSLGLGAPALHRAYELALGGELPVEKLLEAVADTSDNRVTSAIYARGWLLTHYLTFENDRRGQLDRYIAALNAGTPGPEAGRAAFGDLTALNRELIAYMKRPRMSYAVLPPHKLGVGAVTVRRLSPGVAAMMPVHIRSTRGVTREEALALLPDARRIAGGFPDDAVVQAQLAEAAFDAGYVKEAEAAADRALAADPASMRAMLYKGMVLADQAKDAAGWRAARAWFIKANKVDANAAEPLLHFYDSFRGAGLKPNANAVAGLHRAFQLAPEDRGTRLRVAVQAITDKDGKLARRALAPMAYDPHESGLRRFAAGAITLIDAGKLDEAAKAINSPREEAADGDEE